MANNRNSRSREKICEHMSFAAREAFKRLRTNTAIALEQIQGKECYVIGVTSAQPSEGKSTVSINLAYSLAETGKSVLLIDGDMRRPTIHTVVGQGEAQGLSDVLTGETALKNVIVRYESSLGDTRFDMIFSGGYPENPSELLNSGKFRKLIEVVAGVYDYVIIDLPPVNVVVDAVSVSRCTDGLLVVIRENHCPRGVLVDCVNQLKYAKANILGFVMNGCTGGSGKGYRSKQQYYYQYGK